MDIFGFITMLGGLALFLYGMNVLSVGLEKISGGKLERILERLTSNPLKAVLLGAGVTAVIQSSSATTVMVVGFVNSGIMKLSQVVGIIMGANIGTTATAWILSLTGIQGDNILIQLLKPSTFSPILALAGIILLMASKDDKKKDVGSILLGFAILMFGMETMSNAVKPLANVPEFTRLLLIFQNPLLGVLAGALLTAVIQSSSASVGILQALSATGSVTYGIAVPIIMGQNIGTCITAILSGIGASKNAKRAALVHLYFNIVGTVIFMLLFYVANALIGFSFIDDGANAAGIAVVHSVFNVTATALLLPFAKLLERLAYLTIREDETVEQNEEERPYPELSRLDERFLATPGFAVDKSIEMTRNMAALCMDNVLTALSLRNKFKGKGEEKILKGEDLADHYEDALGSYLIKLNGKDLSYKDSQTVTMLLHCIGDFERISDHSVNIMEAAKEMKEKGLSFSEKAREELSIMEKAVAEALSLAVGAFCNSDMEMAVAVEPLEEVIDSLKLELKKRHIKRLRKGKCTVELGFVLTDLINNYERIADHCSNIAVCMIELQENSFDTHEYLNELKRTGDQGFGERVHMYQEKYILP